MARFRIVIETRDGYEKTIDAKSVVDARRIIEEDDGWGDPAHGWKRTDDCYSNIERIERLKVKR